MERNVVLHLRGVKPHFCHLSKKYIQSANDLYFYFTYADQYWNKDQKISVWKIKANLKQKQSVTIAYLNVGNYIIRFY